MKFKTMKGHGHWHLFLGRFYIGFWLDEIVGWNFPRRGGTCAQFWVIAFGIGEIRWYDKFK